METFMYEVVSIDGDYANLKRTDIESDELKLVARALLPPEISEGTKLKYEWLQYEIAQQRIKVREINTNRKYNAPDHIAPPQMKKIYEVQH